MTAAKFAINAVKVLRSILFALVLLVIALPVVAYVLLSSSWASDRIRDIGSRELSALLGTGVSIDDVRYSPFNRLGIHGVSVKDDNDSTALTVREIDARFELWDLLIRRKIIIDYASITGLDLHLYRDSVGAPLNIERIVRRLSRPDSDRPAAVFRLRLNDVSLADCSFSYDVLSAPATPGRFNPSHISVGGLGLAAFAPVVSNDDYRVRLRSLSFTEASGFTLTDLAVNARLTQQALTLENLTVELPASRLGFAPIHVPVDSIANIRRIAVVDTVDIAVVDGSHIYLPDLRSLVPALADADVDVAVALDMSGSRDHVKLRRLSLADDRGMLRLEASGTLDSLTHIRDLLMTDVDVSLHTDTLAINRALGYAGARLQPRVRSLLASLGPTSVALRGSGTLSSGTVLLDVDSHLAKVAFKGRLHRPADNSLCHIAGDLSVSRARLGVLLDNPDLQTLSADATIDCTLRPGSFAGDIAADISALGFKGYTYRDIAATASIGSDNATVALGIDDPGVAGDIDLVYSKSGAEHTLLLDAELTELRLDSLLLSDRYPGYNLTGRLHAQARGTSVDRFAGSLDVEDVRFRDDSGAGISLRRLSVDADNLGDEGRIAIASDVLNGTVDGAFRPSSIGHDITRIYTMLLPALAPPGPDADAAPDYGVEPASDNRFTLDFTLADCEDICQFFKLPVYPISAVSVTGYLNGPANSMHLHVDAPWLDMGGSIVQQTNVVVDIDADEDRGVVFVTSYVPTKKGDMDLEARVFARDGAVDTDILWSLEPAKPISGTISFTTAFSRNDYDQLVTQVRFNPGEINFGDEIWSIQKSIITYCEGRAHIDTFALNTPMQSVMVTGALGASDLDVLTVDLVNIQLINIFETLDIDKALISGMATGRVTARGLLGPDPKIACDKLSVAQIGYNYCTIGDADVRLSVDDGARMFNFAADVTQPGGHSSTIKGYIEIPTETLDLRIDADHVKVGFMKPFMEAFTSDVQGFASGTAHLYGTFKDIDLTGDIYADSLRIKIDFTNTYYTASDSIHIRPGIIDLKDIVISDEYGNTAMLNGWVAHKYFHEASFDFAVTNARNFLSYDVTEKLSPDWYGRIFGNGSATIKGQPGVVDIGVNMSTAPNTTFTFVLSDQLEADEYSFITFRDATPRVASDSILGKNAVPERVRMRSSGSGGTEDAPTAYNMDINIDILPQAQIVIVMDPVGGDRIRSNGTGHMRMTYGSVDNDLRLYGTYTLEHGSYNFTLQDIIIKDFTIKEGSSITFLGDPYSAQLDIEAYYQVNANLSDLDESFLQDKDLNRTNVPVRALMLVKGDMRQPDISFDLEFPTLTQDTYRKVRSIVSTEDMMNRQIIYLLALNRFYTPEYMASTTKGNELFSVASSTISSQLSSMLGKLSDNWSIAPNLRSDRGDFSDLEVDLTLSSSLLNNRLLFNGNFGYRDKSLNTNQFVGDFDIEYLLNRSGDWRLKAYNRYNDQNYYLRTAQTTQGIGIVYRRDFDKSLRFFKNIFKKRPATTDTIPGTETKIQ